MKMPTIHCMENNKILCGKNQGKFAFMDIKDFEKGLKEYDAALLLGGCSKCEKVLKSREANRITPTHNQ